MGFLSSYLPNSQQYLSQQQQDSANNMGLMNAGLNMVDASSNHYGLRPSFLQIGTQGMRGYGQGAQGYVSGMNDMNTAAMNNLTTQRALSHFYPGNKAGAMAGAMTPQDGQINTPTATATALPAPTSSGDATGPDQINASQIQPPPSPLSSYYAQPAPQAAPAAAPQAPQAPAGSATSFGVDVPTMARQLYSQGVDMSYLPGQAAAGAEMMKQAIAMDPTILRSNAYATSQGQLPAELSKIGATGAQARQTEGYKATLDPYDLTDAAGNVTHTNKATAASSNMAGPRVLNDQTKSLMATDQKTMETMQPEYDAAQHGLAAVAQIKQLAQLSAQNPLTRPGPFNKETSEALAVANDLIRRTGGTPIAAKELASSRGIDKLGTEMQAAATKILGSREAAQIFNQMGKTVPNSLLDPATLNLIASTAEQKFQRTADRYNVLSKTISSPGVYTIDPTTKQYITGVSAINAYDKTNPGSDYATQANQNAGMAPAVDYKPGLIRNGYMFKGGDPKSKDSWVPAQ